MQCIQCGQPASGKHLRTGDSEPLCAECFEAGPDECTATVHVFDFNAHVCRCGYDDLEDEP